MAEEKKIMEFKETNEEMENNIPEETPEQKTLIEVPTKKGFLAKWKELKWWQRAAILAGTGTLIYLGGKWIFKIGKDTKIHEAEGQAILDTLENVQPIKVVTPMDMTNPADTAVQDLVNEVAKVAE